MNKTVILITALIAMYTCANAQILLTLQPDAVSGKDNQVYSNQPNSNYVSDLLRGMTWTFQGDPGTIRGLFQFDLSSIPLGSTIDSSFLYLYAPNAPTTEFHSGSNAAFLKRITSDWGESTVTWNNQPSTTEDNRVTLPMSTSEYQDYGHIDVSNLVQDMINNPLTSFGFILMQQVEAPLRRLSFCSSDYPDNSNHPKLEIYYTPPTCTNIILRQDGSGQDNQVFSLQPTSNYVSDLLRGMSWTFQGTPGVMRSLLEFNFSSIPANSEIVYAYLSLYSPDPPTTEFHSGNNSAFLQRITSEWNESTVTWNNQPSTTTLHQISLPASTEAYQDYVDIDVTTLVTDMFENLETSFGFLLRQQVEEDLRRLSFVSGDYPNQQKQPKLEICFNAPLSVSKNVENNFVNIYPNPSHDFIQIDLTGNIQFAHFEILDILGNLILESDINKSEYLNISDLLPSVFFLRILSDKYEVLSFTKIIKQ